MAASLTRDSPANDAVSVVYVYAPGTLEGPAVTGLKEVNRG